MKDLGEQKLSSQPHKVGMIRGIKVGAVIVEEEEEDDDLQGTTRSIQHIFSTLHGILPWLLSLLRHLFVRSLFLFQHGKSKGNTATNGEWTVGETHPPSIQDAVANVNHRRTLLQPMGARGEDEEPTNGRSD